MGVGQAQLRPLIFAMLLGSKILHVTLHIFVPAIPECFHSKFIQSIISVVFISLSFVRADSFQQGLLGKYIGHRLLSSDLRQDCFPRPSVTLHVTTN